MVNCCCSQSSSAIKRSSNAVLAVASKKPGMSVNPTGSIGRILSRVLPRPESQSRVGENPVEELPPELERAFDGGTHLRLQLRCVGEAHDDVIADVAVLAIGLFVDVPEADLVARQAVVRLERAREGSERAR